MKVLKVICLSQMVASAVPGRHRRQTSGACAEARLQIELDTLNAQNEGRTPSWTIGGEMPVKRGCHALTYDIQFCTQVCELAQGQECVPRQNPADDRCGRNLDCLPSGATYTCQELPAFDDSSSSSSYLDYFYNNVYVPDLALLPGDYDYEK
jgi:hypothetical protein